MALSHNISESHAKTALILGHISTGMGEKTLAIKFKRALEQAGHAALPIIDICEWMGEDYESLAKLNYDLADTEFPICEDLQPLSPVAKSDILVILSWCFSIAALFATGIHKTRPTIAKLFAHHPNERILTKLYEPADLLITESLLANERALTYGIDPGKVLYLPHSYPQECESLRPSRRYVEQLAERQGKPLCHKTKVIGCVGRFEYGKNYEWAVEAVRLLAAQNNDVVLVLKGDFPQNSPYPDYKPKFTEMLQAYQNEAWLLWDPTPSPFPHVLEEYASFDLLLHPSGAEGGSHVVIECLGLQKPVVVLDCSTNPYLFKGLATFVKTRGEIRPGPLPFYVPDLDELCKALKNMLPQPDRNLIQARFHERNLRERIPLLFDREPARIKELYREDCKNYGL